jgi:hypothetical protein
MTNDPEEAVSCTTLLKINKKVLMLCMFLAGKEIEQVEYFIFILSNLSRGVEALLEFVTPEDHHHTISVVVNVGRHEWYAEPQLYTRDDATGLRERRHAMSS